MSLDLSPIISVSASSLCKFSRFLLPMALDSLPPASRWLPMRKIHRDKPIEVFEEWRWMPRKVMY